MAVGVRPESGYPTFFEPVPQSPKRAVTRAVEEQADSQSHPPTVMQENGEDLDAANSPRITFGVLDWYWPC